MTVVWPSKLVLYTVCMYSNVNSFAPDITGGGEGRGGRLGASEASFYKFSTDHAKAIKITQRYALIISNY